MPFTPIESTIGGLIIASSVASHLYTTGYYSGMSSVLANTLTSLPRIISKPSKKDIMKDDMLLRTLAYMIGLLVAGFLCRWLLVPQHFIHGASMFSYQKQVSLINQPIFMFLIAGFLVGFGTRLGGGCTSGHMICGVSRLSYRSITATILFSTTALLTVKLFNRAHAINILYGGKSNEFIAWPSLSSSLLLVSVALFIWMVYAIILLYGRKNKPRKKSLIFLLHIWDAFTFSMGLSISGMTLPTKVLGFFDIFGKYWDPSLFCVAATAIGLNMYLWNMYILPKDENKPDRTPLFNSKFTLPSKYGITRDLVIGAIVFGLGWGFLGFCPGPSIVNMATLKPELLLFYGAFALGAQLQNKFKVVRETGNQRHSKA